MKLEPHGPDRALWFPIPNFILLPLKSCVQIAAGADELTQSRIKSSRFLEVTSLSAVWTTPEACEPAWWTGIPHLKNVIYIVALGIFDS